ncbi:MAG: FliH/SctL family protein [bacterium]
MSNVIRDFEVNLENDTIYDGSKIILANVIKSGNIDEDEELLKLLESIPPAIQKFILNHIESYKKKLDGTIKDKEELIFKENKSKGYKEGFAEGKIEAIKSLEKEVKNMTQIASEIGQFKNILYNDVTKDAVDLSLKIAEKIVKSAVLSDNDFLKNIISDAVGKAANSTYIIIYLNPSDYASFSKNPEIAKDLSKNVQSNISFASDPNLLPGNTFIKTDFGEIDAKIETQLQQIEKAFNKIVPN